MQFESVIKSFSRKDLPGSEAEFTGDVPFEVLTPYREQALKDISADAELPGFRKGKAPADMIIKKVGELGLLQEAVNLFVREFYPQLIESQKIDAVGRPEVRILKLAPGNPTSLSIRTAVYPEVKLPYRWNSIHEDFKLEPTAPATEEEMNQTLESLRQSRKKDGVVPELSDEFAKSVGAFDSLEALKNQIQKGIGEEKERAARDKRRAAILDKVIEKSEVEVPQLFVETELEKIVAQMKDDVKKFGLTFEGYLKQVNKTEGAVREDFKEQAQKRAKLQLVLNKIAEDEKIEADRAAVEQEMKHALEHFPEAKPELLGIHISTILRNEKVLKLLEGEK